MHKNWKKKIQAKAINITCRSLINRKLLLYYNVQRCSTYLLIRSAATPITSNLYADRTVNNSDDNNNYY